MKTRFLQSKKLLLVAMMAMMGTNVWATSNFHDDQNVYYAIIPNSTTVKVTFPNSSQYNPYGSGSSTYAKPTGDITIYKTIYDETTEVTYTVVSIDQYAFSSCSGITSVTFAEGIEDLTSIGNSAFLNCSNLTSIAIPTCVTSLGSYVFSGCTSLSTIALPSTITSIQTQTFNGCNSLTSFTIPASVTTIQNNAFKSCGLTSITIPATVTTLSSYAFEDCTSLASVTFASGTGISTLSSSVFKGCTSLTQVSFSNTGLKTISDKAFENCTSLTSITIPSSVTTITPNPFYGCSSLSEIIVASDNSNYSSGDGANCIMNKANTQLKVGCNGTVIPNTVTSIETKAFQGCNGLTSITIPSSVKYYNTYMFDGCTNLSSVTFNTTSPTTLSNYAFQNCTSLINFTIPSNITTIGNNTFQGCTGLTRITIPSCVTNIGQQAFYGCSNLKTITIPSCVTNIGQQAFYGCSNLKTITVLGNNVSLGTKAFHKDFSSIISDLNIYVPSDQVTTYKGATNWSTYASNIDDTGVTVITDSEWSSASSTAHFNINANCVIPENTDITVSDLIVSNGVVLTVSDGASLTSTTIENLGGSSSLVISDGGQLICNNGVNATLQKEITKAEVWGVPGADAWYFIASPVNEYATSNVIITGTSDTDLFSFDEGSGYWYNAQGSDHPFTSLNRGQGYLYANNTGDDLAFMGEMPATNSNIEKDFSYVGSGSAQGFNLMGNPFTCNLTNTMVKIKNDDESLTAITSYYTVENGTELSLVEDFSKNPIKPGRGFLIQATAANQKLVFNPSGSKQQEASAKPSFITIEAGNEQFMDRACIQIGNGNTLRKMTINDQVSHVYVMHDGKDYAAATIAEAQGEMPVNFKANENGQYTLTVNTENVEMNYLHLIDNMTGADIDLLLTPSYTFSAKTYDYESRFRLVFAANEGASTGSATDATFAYIDANGNIIVNGGPSTPSTGSGTEGSGTLILQVIDVLGHQLLTKEFQTSYFQLPTSSLPAGVYVLRLVNGNNTKTQKIVVR